MRFFLATTLVLSLAISGLDAIPAKFLKDGVRQSGEVKIHCKDGDIANTLYTTVTMELSHGRSFQVTTLVDITDRKQMEYSLKLAKVSGLSLNSEGSREKRSIKEATSLREDRESAHLP